MTANSNKKASYYYEMVTVQFTKTVKLPRFTMVTGETWNLARRRFRTDGSFDLGAGVVRSDDYAEIASEMRLTHEAKAARQ